MPCHGHVRSSIQSPSREAGQAHLRGVINKQRHSFSCRQVMKASKGLANPKLLNQALNKKLKDALEAAQT